MKKFLCTLIFILSSFTFAQSQFQQFINHVNSLGDPLAKQAAVDSFMTYAELSVFLNAQACVLAGLSSISCCSGMASLRKVTY